MDGIETFSDGSAAFMAYREPGWHALGTVVQDAPKIDDALRLAHMDWLVTKQPVFAHIVTDDGVTPYELPGTWATMRDHPETGEPDAGGHFVSWNLLAEHMKEEAASGADPTAIPER